MPEYLVTYATRVNGSRPRLRQQKVVAERACDALVALPPRPLERLLDVCRCLTPLEEGERRRTWQGMQPMTVGE